MAVLERVLNDGHHRIVELRDELVSGRYEDFALVRFGACLIEPFAKILPVEANEIDDGLRRDADGLSGLHVESKADIARQLPLPQHGFCHVSPHMNLRPAALIACARAIRQSPWRL